MRTNSVRLVCIPFHSLGTSESHSTTEIFPCGGPLCWTVHAKSIDNNYSLMTLFINSEYYFYHAYISLLNFIMLI